MTLTTEQKVTFDENGFIVLKGFFTRQLIDKVSSWLDELQEETSGSSAHAAK